MKARCLRFPDIQVMGSLNYSSTKMIVPFLVDEYVLVNAIIHIKILESAEGTEVCCCKSSFEINPPFSKLYHY